MSYSIGALAQAFGLSRSTLIYYDKIDLLKPSARSQANYREYTESDYQRLSRIIMYREAGMLLQRILEVIENKNEVERSQVLEAQLEQLNKQIALLRKQQQVTVELLRHNEIETPVRSMNKAQWVKLLESTGMSDEDMWHWHIEFERLMPEAHQDFLESLNISLDEISEIRKKSRLG